MKKAILFVAGILSIHQCIVAQNYDELMIVTVSKLNQATEIKDYHKLGSDFSRIANGYPNEWLPAYYAAYCYARIGWLNQYDPEKIEPFTDQADKQIGKALALVDTLNQKKAVSEIYSVLSRVC